MLNAGGLGLQPAGGRDYRWWFRLQVLHVLGGDGASRLSDERSSLGGEIQAFRLDSCGGGQYRSGVWHQQLHEQEVCVLQTAQAQSSASIRAQAACSNLLLPTTQLGSSQVL